MSGRDWEPRIRALTDNQEERIVYAASLLRDDKFEQAYQELDRILEKDETSYAATLLMGLVYQQQKKIRNANACFLKAMDLDPMQAQPAMLCGFTTSLLGDQETAAKLFAAALHIDPRLAPAHVGMAHVLDKLDELPQAIAHAKTALQIDPELSQARLVLARCYRRLGKIDRAIAELETLVGTGSAPPAAMVELATLYAQKGEATSAVNLIEATTRLFPDHAPAWSELGAERMRSADYSGAEQAYRQLVKLRPNDRTGSLRLVDALIPQKKFDEALELLNKIPRRGKTAALVSKAFGDVYAAQNLSDEAANWYRAALLQSPEGVKVVAELDHPGDAEAAVDDLMQKYREALYRSVVDRRDSDPLGNQPAPARGGAGGSGGDPGTRRVQLGRTRKIAIAREP